LNSAYTVKLIGVYERFLKNKSPHVSLMELLSTEMLREYRNGSEFNSVNDRKLLGKLIEFFSQKENYIRCEQLKRILNGSPLEEHNLITK